MSKLTFHAKSDSNNTAEIDTDDIIDITNSYMPLWALLTEYGQWAVFAESEQDVLDILVDKNLFDAFLVDESDLSRVVVNENGEDVLDDTVLTRLGNAGELFDTSNIMNTQIFELKLTANERTLISLAYDTGYHDGRD
jgi:hypothetical protein